MKQNQHVVPRDGRWAVRSEGDGEVVRVFDSQSEAIDHARELARSKGGELFIHGRDGRIREKNSYGSDRHPPKG